MAVVALTLLILWIWSLWLFVLERGRPLGFPLRDPLALMSGTLLFVVLSLAGLLFLQLLFGH